MRLSYYSSSHTWYVESSFYPDSIHHLQNSNCMQYEQHQWCFFECLVVHTYHKYNRINPVCLDRHVHVLYGFLWLLRLEAVNSVEAKVPTSTELRSHEDDACGPACSPWPAADTGYPTPFIVNFFSVFAMTAWMPLSRVSAGSRNNSVAHRQPREGALDCKHTKKMVFFSTLIEATLLTRHLWSYGVIGVVGLWNWWDMWLWGFV